MAITKSVGHKKSALKVYKISYAAYSPKRGDYTATMRIRARSKDEATGIYIRKTAFFESSDFDIIKVK